MSSRPKELNEAFVRGLPDAGAVVMINLVRFKPISDDGQGSGWEAYLRYSQSVAPLIKAVGGTVLWAGDVEGAAYGDLGGGGWHYAVLVRYPSRAAFLDMVTSHAYAAANVHREHGVEDHLILASRETYSKVPPT
jgi:uncharacterized protein (DUF1330 family)